MELSLSGLRVVVGPDSALAPREIAALDGLTRQRTSDGSGLRLELLEQPPFSDADADDAAPAPARVYAHGLGLRVAHRLFRAEIDAGAGTTRLWRREPDGTGLLIALRVALSAALPLRGGLPLHAAGVVLDGQGLACFGPSGAGKTTLAESALACALEVLSDEQVTLLPGPRLLASGFWGALDRRAPATVAPLGALIALGRGPRVSLQRLTPEAARRLLLDVLFVPPQPTLWASALAAVGVFTGRVPIWRLTWHPQTPPWDELRAALAREATHA